MAFLGFLGTALSQLPTMFAGNAASSTVAASNSAVLGSMAGSQVSQSVDDLEQMKFWTSMGRQDRQFSAKLNADTELANQGFQIQQLSINSYAAEKSAIAKLADQVPA